METVIPGLYASAPQPLSFAPTTHVRAFVLQRAEGNLLVYSAASLRSEVPAIAELGGVTGHYLNHWHEAAFGGGDQIGALGAPLFCHENERASVSKTAKVAGSFTSRHKAGDDFEVIPIPGHTAGATAYLWDNGRHRCLFTGDSVYLRDGEWVAAVLESSDRGAYIESLELIKELEFDVLVPGRRPPASRAMRSLTRRPQRGGSARSSSVCVAERTTESPSGSRSAGLRKESG